MTLVVLKKIDVCSKQAPFGEPITFQITFQCVEDIDGVIEWKMIYIGSGESEDFDQMLGRVSIGPIPRGLNRFVFEGCAPDITRIPHDEIVDVTVVLLIGTYKEQEFVRVGYYIRNEYTGPEQNTDSEEGAVPKELRAEDLTRVFVSNETPRVTYFPIGWTCGYTELPALEIAEEDDKE
uniref:Anti-silencing function protein 1 n=1 Tax=Metchnikovella dogieli TaxID=2804710 RepID=A0A896WNA3_9MICR|nr:histone chaperone ASF1 [Metchnikovella dogieli]